MKKYHILMLLIVLCLCIIGCNKEEENNNNDNINQEPTIETEFEKQTSDIYRLAQKSGYTGTYEQWLETIKGTPGKSAYELAVELGYKGTIQEWLEMLKGQDGKNVELSVNGEFIVWRNEDTNTWNNLISLNSLKGQDGRDIELSTTTTHVVWRYVGEEKWNNLLELSTIIQNDSNTSTGKSAYELAVELGFKGTIEDWLESLKGTDGKTPEFEVIDSYLCWRYVGDKTWIKLFKIDNLSGGGLIEYHTVTFVDPAGQVLLTQEVQDGKKVTKPQNLYIINGYDVIDWKVGDESWSFIGYSVTEDIILTACTVPHLFNISYVMNEGVFETSYFEHFNVEEDLQLVKPSKYNYVFEGWYLEPDFKTKVINTSDLPYKDVVLYAKFVEPEKFTITYELNGGTFKESYLTEFTQFTTGIIPSPKQDNYSFTGWYLDTNFTNKVKYYSDLPYQNVTLYAKFDVACNINPDSEYCKYVDTWSWQYNQLGFDGKGMKIVIMSGAPEDIDPFNSYYSGERKLDRQKQIVLIEQAYNIDLVIERYPDSAAWGPSRVEWINNNAAAGTLLQQGHIYQINSSWIPTLVKGNSIAELYDVNSKTGIFKSLFYEQNNIINKLSAVGSKVYGYSSDTLHADQFLFYNQNLVEEYNLEDPATLWNKGVWDWTTFKEYLITAQNAFGQATDEYMYSFGIAIQDASYPMLGARGAKFIDEETNRVLFTDPAVVQFYNDLREIYYSGMWAPDAKANDVPGSFVQGRLLFTHGYLWFLESEMRFKGQCDFPIGVVPYPTSDGYAKPANEILDEYYVPFSETTVYSFPKVENGENGLTTEILVNICHDFCQGLVPEYNENEYSQRDQYIYYLSRIINGPYDIVEQCITAIMSIEDNIKTYGYIDYMDIVSKSVGGGSAWQGDGFATWCFGLVTSEDFSPEAILQSKQYIYQNCLDEIIG